MCRFLVEVVCLESDSDARAVDGRVQPPELVLGPLERRLHVLWLRHVDRHEDATVALCKDLENNT